MPTAMKAARPHRYWPLLATAMALSACQANHGVSVADGSSGDVGDGPIDVAASDDGPLSSAAGDSAARDDACTVILVGTYDGAQPVATTCFTSQLCSAEEDCAAFTTPGDACRTGYTCAIAFVSGPLACQAVCTCKDRLGSGAGTVPIAYHDGGG